MSRARTTSADVEEGESAGLEAAAALVSMATLHYGGRIPVSYTVAAVAAVAGVHLLSGPLSRAGAWLWSGGAQGSTNRENIQQSLDRLLARQAELRVRTAQYLANLPPDVRNLALSTLPPGDRAAIRTVLPRAQAAHQQTILRQRAALQRSGNGKSHAAAPAA